MKNVNYIMGHNKYYISVAIYNTWSKPIQVSADKTELYTPE